MREAAVDAADPLEQAAGRAADMADMADMASEAGAALVAMRGIPPAAGQVSVPARARREAGTITAEQIFYVPHTMAVFDASVRAKLDDIIARLRKNAYDHVEIAAGAFARTETLTSHKTRAIRTYLILRDIDEARISTRTAYPGDEHLDALWYARRSAVEITIKWSPPKVFMIPLTLGKNTGARRFARHPVLPYA
ncbi:hypothetical protein [Bordetella sp. LUAb4]|uniref:hypothetical protein n=1 Tax=Bordetella sp. LUAb4 TaxID=2843195 RepID=UPI001E4D4C9A|nr:hypothetical protein [Bordetella sp. LUAb4]